MTDQTPVFIYYFESTEVVEKSVKELRDYFTKRGEDQGWIEGFIKQIEVTGYAFTRLGAKYSLKKHKIINY